LDALLARSDLRGTSVAFSGVAFLLVLVEKDIPLRTELHTDFGLEDVELVGKQTAS
jgi:hypothetical protein